MGSKLLSEVKTWALELWQSFNHGELFMPAVGGPEGDPVYDTAAKMTLEIKKEEMPFYGCVDDDVAEPAVINAIATIDGMVHAVCFIDCIKDGEQWKPIFNHTGLAE